MQRLIYVARGGVNGGLTPFSGGIALSQSLVHVVAETCAAAIEFGKRLDQVLIIFPAVPGLEIAAILVALILAEKVQHVLALLECFCVFLNAEIFVSSSNGFASLF